MIRRPPRSTLSSSSAASDVYKRQPHCRLVGAAVEILHRHDPFTAGPADDTAGVEGRAYRRKVLGGIGLTQRAADRAAVADHGVGDHPFGVAENREHRGEFGGLK